MDRETATARIATALRDMGYGPDDDEVVVDDLATAAEGAGFAYDLNDDEDCAVLSAAVARVLA